jgi:hypothetical protein
MPPAPLVGVDLEARRHARWLGLVAVGTGRASAPAGAGVWSLPWLIGMVLANPAGVVTTRADSGAR